MTQISIDSTTSATRCPTSSWGKNFPSFCTQGTSLCKIMKGLSAVPLNSESKRQTKKESMRRLREQRKALALAQGIVPRRRGRPLGSCAVLVKPDRGRRLRRWQHAASLKSNTVDESMMYPNIASCSMMKATWLARKGILAPPPPPLASDRQRSGGQLQAPKVSQSRALAAARWCIPVWPSDSSESISSSCPSSPASCSFEPPSTHVDFHLDNNISKLVIFAARYLKDDRCFLFLIHLSDEPDKFFFERDDVLPFEHVDKFWMSVPMLNRSFGELYDRQTSDGRPDFSFYKPGGPALSNRRVHDGHWVLSYDQFFLSAQVRNVWNDRTYDL